MYGTLPLAEILAETRKTGAGCIDCWPKPHGNQREQIDAMGHEAFAAMLREHRMKLGCLTRYDLGPFGLQPEMPILRKLGGSLLVCGAKGPRGLEGDVLKAAVETFVEQLKPHIAVAEELGVTIGIENHSSSLIESFDSMKWFAELADTRHVGVALAPYHLPQDPEAIGKLIEALGPKLAHLYAWQHGKGSREKLPKAEQLLQMPGRGPMDFTLIVAALKRIGYAGWTEIFMHPVPRGVPILETAAEVTAEINRARAYLDRCVEKIT